MGASLTDNAFDTTIKIVLFIDYPSNHYANLKLIVKSCGIRMYSFIILKQVKICLNSFIYVCIPICKRYKGKRCLINVRFLRIFLLIVDF